MNEVSAAVVKIYLREQEHLLKPLVKFLNEDQKVAGLTVLRGIEGGTAGRGIHTTSLLALSLDLPLVVEFYDDQARARQAAEQAALKFALKHVVILPATALVVA